MCVYTDVNCAWQDDTGFLLTSDTPAVDASAAALLNAARSSSGGTDAGLSTNAASFKKLGPLNP